MSRVTVSSVAQDWEAVTLSADGFEFGYVAGDGAQHRVRLADAWAVRFEAMVPARRFNARKGQRHLSGRWWSGTDGVHVGYESWLERDHVMALDFDPTVVGIASQPFWLFWTRVEGRVRSHAPDYFARRVDGTAVVVDCRPVERRPPRDVAAFEATIRACELLGWEYRLVGSTNPILTANLRWLAGYRHPRHSIPALAGALRAAFAEPGLWGISFGNDAANQPRNTLFFAAGINNQANGSYGRIDLGGAPTLNAPPVVTLAAPAENVTGVVTLTATVTDPISIANVKFFVNTNTLIGTVTTPPFTVQWDSTTVPNGGVTLTATATDVDGNVGTSPVVNATVGPPAVTLTQLQTQVFTPLCSGCHNGSQPSGGALPGSQNLTAEHTFSNIVGVASLEQPNLMRVKPGDPDNSYLIHKVEGTAGITGAQMPLGGPPLSQATIDQIRSWISSGAPNN